MTGWPTCATCGDDITNDGCYCGPLGWDSDPEPRSDIARPVTVADAAKVLLGDALDLNGSEEWDELTLKQAGKVVAILRALSQGGE